LPHHAKKVDGGEIRKEVILPGRVRSVGRVKEIEIKGRSICPGIAIGTAYVFGSGVEVRRSKISSRDVNLEGIGLFRTEFLLYSTDSFPDEDEQYAIYKRTIDAMQGRPFVLRTFDVGADKRLPYLERCVGQNPALGLRGIRRQLLRCPGELNTQLRAALRAAAGTTLQLLFPMITTVDELRKIKELLSRVKADLQAEGKTFCSELKIGAMIEIPSAAISIKEILSEVDFVSVGTNDLIQYFTAADRDNEAVSHFGDISNEAVVFLLRYIIDGASEMGRRDDVTICGEIASDPGSIPLLLKLGYRSLSISSVLSHRIRTAISETDLSA
jgi:phosphotransferase system enzyme I (PtsI)